MKPRAVRTTALACIVGETSPLHSLTPGEGVLSVMAWLQQLCATAAGVIQSKATRISRRSHFFVAFLCLLPRVKIRPPVEREAESPGGKICDVPCDITLVSKPLQVLANGSVLIYVADGGK